jgi:hypothetical protein
MNEDASSALHERNGSTRVAEPESGGIFEVANGVYTTQASSLSPSLWKNREEPAFELKFQLPEERAALLAAWAEAHLRRDPHCLPEMNYTYCVHGLYFDTPAFDVFHRSPGYKKKKYRLRRYGANAKIFLEQKRKSGGKVAKRRIEVDEPELERLREIPTESEWTGQWFHRRIAKRQLQPTCSISYRRQAFYGANAEGPLRLTLDRDVRSRLASEWRVAEVLEGVPMLAGQILLELKFRKHLPAIFKGLMQDFNLMPGSLSKYRLAIESLGVAPMKGGLANGLLLPATGDA